MKYLNATLLIFALITSYVTHAQLTSGSIKMEITDFEMAGMDNDDGMAGQLKNMMKSMGMTINFRPGEQVTEMTMMGMISLKQHFKDGVMYQYMDMMGQKMLIKTPTGIEAFKEMGINEDEFKEAYQITYDKSINKTILGYNCYKATIKMDMTKISQENVPEQMSSVNIVMYITKDIKMDHFNMQQLPGIDLDGVPLSMEMKMGEMKMTFEASEIDKSVDAKIFEKPEGNYKEMSMDDLKKMGINPSGFGF